MTTTSSNKQTAQVSGPERRRSDQLTRLPNRMAVEERLQALLDDNAGAAVILLGLEGLKKINDDLGHRAGDNVLSGLAIRLPALLPSGGILARTEGSRFAAIVPGMGDPIRATGIAAQLLQAINQPFSIGDHSVKLSAGAGLAFAPAQAETADELLSNAALALQNVAGHEGKVCLFEPAMRAAAAALQAMRAEIMHAVDGRELELHFQPQFELASGGIIGAEALLRWNHSLRGQLAPPAFLSALEGHSLAPEVGDWVLDEACRHVASWRRTRLPSARVSVNLFAGQLNAGNLPEVVFGALRRHDLPPEALELELAERTVNEGGSRVDDQLRALRNARVRLALDNFGAGNASLALLKRLPLTTLKVDRGLVGNMLRDKTSGAMVTALLDMAQVMKLDTIAEGVETAPQEARLVAAGCRFGQGYRFARPMAPKRFAKFAVQGRKAKRAA